MLKIENKKVINIDGLLVTISQCKGYQGNSPGAIVAGKQKITVMSTNGDMEISVIRKEGSICDIEFINLSGDLNKQFVLELATFVARKHVEGGDK